MQPSNAPGPTFVTLSGIDTLVSAVQFLNALNPIVSTFEGISTDLSVAFPLNAFSPIALTSPGIVTNVSFPRYAVSTELSTLKPLSSAALTPPPIPALMPINKRTIPTTIIAGTNIFLIWSLVISEPLLSAKLFMLF